MKRVSICAALYILAVHYAYVAYINPTFEYAHYTYLPFETSSLLITYALAWIPVLAYRDTPHPAQAIVALIYAMSYVPIQLSLLFTIDKDYSEVILPQLALAASMVILFRAARTARRPINTAYRDFLLLDTIVGTLVILATLMVALPNLGRMRFVSFADVYDLRMETAGAEQGVVEAYLVSWLSYCFVSYLFARGIVYRRWPMVLLGLTASVVLYMSTGAKASILMLPITYGVILVWRGGRGFLARLLMLMLAAIAILTAVIPDFGVFMWAKSIILVRMIGSSGWTTSKYFEYFGEHGWTYYTHIGPIQALFGGYPYGQLLLGQVIGIAYSGTSEANFNANFWASDGFAALGTMGIFVITPFVAMCLYLLNRLTVILPSAFTVGWMVGFMIALLNLPFTTAMLSGGGGGILLLAWCAKRAQRQRQNRQGKRSVSVPAGSEMNRNEE
ncbi:hypothetical protein PCO31111_01207 [Pandoraea communis]|uniref:O-antigen polymerase n=1 Tax=Pandoraea communis TaxID=2508297 RepID=A0A5E4T8I9_9BURK|nr:hypothetical protein [Pandoraea communis]VVD82888.1 hypothetical protein PCO31111_01207 [Pandoraea communis]